ncbi:DUF4488 domain-containing protein [Ornithobacterium rhinotracheale]|uniref:DUF4488 domain-containing protein n=1 Tax=Ornithobacterium rhinotracheale TaxID=28251 RepID=UPI004036A08D
MMRKFNLSKKIALILFLCVTTLSFAQQKKHIAEQEGLAGFWVQMIPYDYQGDARIMRSGQNKIMNPDGTFYCFLTDNKGVQGISFYGNYNVTSDSTYVEHIVNSVNPKSVNTTSDLKYKFLTKDVLLISFKNNSFKNGKEISEIWFRVKQMNTPFLLPKQEEVKAELRKILSQSAK